MKKYFLLVILTCSFSSVYAWRADCPNLAKEIAGSWKDSCTNAIMSTHVCKLSATCLNEAGNKKKSSIDTISCFKKNKLKVSNCNGKLTCGPC